MGNTHGETIRPRASAPAMDPRERSRVGCLNGAVPTPVRDTDDRRAALLTESSPPPMTGSREGDPGLRVPCLGDAGQKMEVGEGGSRSGTAGLR